MKFLKRFFGNLSDLQKRILFTLGALIFDFFGEFSEEEIQQRYNNNQFLPCAINKWQLSEEAYRVAIKAVSPDRNKRYLTFAEFWNEWKKAL